MSQRGVKRILRRMLKGTESASVGYLVSVATFLGHSMLPTFAHEPTTLLPREEKSMSLMEQLQLLSEQSKSKLPGPVNEVMQKSLVDLQSSGAVDNVLRVGNMAPDFSLPNASGNTVNLKQVLEKGPVVLIFYRGGWCPYCNLTLRAIQKSLPEIEAQHGTLIAISPQLPDSSISTVEKNNLTFDVLSDRGNVTAKKYGVACEISPELFLVYSSLGIDLFKSNGDDSHKLPLSANIRLSDTSLLTPITKNVWSQRIWSKF